MLCSEVAELMAYEVLFFCDTQSTSAADFAEEVRSAVVDLCGSAVFGPERVGESWVEREVWTSGSDARISLACYLGGRVMEIETNRVSKEPGGNAVVKCGALVRAVLSGAVDDWEMFKVIWRVAEERFSGIPYDDTVGFEVSLD